jgi:hypothetical protein
VACLTRRTKLLVSSLLASATNSAWDFCSVITLSLLRPNVPLPESEDKSVPIGQELLTQNVTFADAEQYVAAATSGVI